LDYLQTKCNNILHNSSDRLNLLISGAAYKTTTQVNYGADESTGATVRP